MSSSKNMSDAKKSRLYTLAPHWQRALQYFCQRHDLPSPAYSLFSRVCLGNRTQWSAGFRVGRFERKALLWYAGWVMDNAKEEVAEDMLEYLISLSPQRGRDLAAEFLVERPLRVVAAQSAPEVGAPGERVLLERKGRQIDRGPRRRENG